MSDELPPMEQIIPAVEHVMGSLDHDAGLIQTVADKLVQAPGSTLDSDKATLKQVKNRLTRAINWSVVKDSGPALSEIGGRMRAAAALPVDSDQERIDALAARLPPLPAVLPPGGPPSPPFIPPPPGVVPNVPPVSYGFWECPNPDLQWIWVYAWHSTYDPNRPPDGPPPGGDPGGRAQQVEQLGGRFGWWNRDGSLASCQPTGLPPPTIVPPCPPPVPILPPPVPIPGPNGGPPVPLPVPAPLPAVSACGPLPAGIPSVAVYVVPWLDPGDSTPSVYSECGRKLIADAQYGLYPAAPLAAAMSYPNGWEDYETDNAGIDDTQPEDTSYATGSSGWGGGDGAV